MLGQTFSYCFIFQKEWIERAERRTKQFYNSGPTSPCTWVLNHGKTIPPGAILVGREHSWNLYVGRAFHKVSCALTFGVCLSVNGWLYGIQGSISKSIHRDISLTLCNRIFQLLERPPMCSRRARSSAMRMMRSTSVILGLRVDLLLTNHQILQKETYEILLGDMNGLRWIPTSGKLNVAALGKTPVDGGVDTDGTPLYVARAQHKGAVHPGKCSEKLKGQAALYEFERDQC